MKKLWQKVLSLFGKGGCSCGHDCDNECHIQAAKEFLAKSPEEQDEFLKKKLETEKQQVITSLGAVYLNARLMETMFQKESKTTLAGMMTEIADRLAKCIEFATVNTYTDTEYAEFKTKLLGGIQKELDELEGKKNSPAATPPDNSIPMQG